MVNALDPGCAATNFSRNNGTWSWLKHRLSYLLRGQLRTPAKGAETIVYLADADEVAGVTGRYFRDKTEMTFRRTISRARRSATRSGRRASSLAGPTSSGSRRGGRLPCLQLGPEFTGAPRLESSSFNPRGIKTSSATG